jgi:hypothetical protein
MKKLFLLLPLLVGCKHFPEISPRDAFASYRVAVYDLGKSLESYKVRTETSFLSEYDSLAEQCKPGEKACEAEVKKTVLKKYSSREESFNKIREFHKRCVETAHVVDTLCAPGESDVCTKSVNQALEKLPEVISKIKELN